MTAACFERAALGVLHQLAFTESLQGSQSICWCAWPAHGPTKTMCHPTHLPLDQHVHVGPLRVLDSFQRLVRHIHLVNHCLRLHAVVMGLQHSPPVCIAQDTVTSLGEQPVWVDSACSAETLTATPLHLCIDTVVIVLEQQTLCSCHHQLCGQWNVSACRTQAAGTAARASPGTATWAVRSCGQGLRPPSSRLRQVGLLHITRPGCGTLDWPLPLYCRTLATTSRQVAAGSKQLTCCMQFM